MLFDKKNKVILNIFSGSSASLHLNNLVSPDTNWLVRPIRTEHVQYLEKSFECKPCGEFHLLVGNMVDGEIEKAREAGGATI